MSASESKYYLPAKTISYLKRLRAEYATSGKNLLAEILSTGRMLVVEETYSDNWNGGTCAHDVKIFLSLDVLRKIRIREQTNISNEILQDLKECAKNIDNESFREVVFELENEDDYEYQKSMPLSQKPQLNANTLTIWKPGHIRLFVSHRDTHKVAAKDLADELEGYGITAFVAHDTIEPMTTWQLEILKGLDTMEVMLAFVTDDFHESTWTNQEIGFALGKNIPVIAMKLQQLDPRGFIASTQALRGHLDRPKESAAEIYRIMAGKLGSGKRLQSSLISAFVQSPDFSETKYRFDRMDEVIKVLSVDEAIQICKGFRVNNQLYNSGYLTSRYERLQTFLRRTTGKKYTVSGKNIAATEDDSSDEVRS